MMPGENQEFRLAQGLNQMRIVWAAIVFSQLVFFPVMLYLRSVSLHVRNPALPMISVALGVSAVGIAVVSLVVPQMPIRRRSQDTRPRPGDPIANEVALRTLPMARPANIMGCALSEAVTLNGFALGFLGADLSLVAPFFVVGILLTLSRFPSVSWILGLLKE